MPALGRQIDAKYKALARILMAFEKKWYSGWLEPVEATISAHLKQPLLRDDPVSKRCAQANVLPEVSTFLAVIHECIPGTQWIYFHVLSFMFACPYA